MNFEEVIAEISSNNVENIVIDSAEDLPNIVPCSNEVEEEFIIDDVDLEGISKVIEQDLSSSEAIIDPNLIEAVVPLDMQDFDSMIALDAEFCAKFKLIVRKFLMDSVMKICIQLNDSIRLKDQIDAFKLYYNDIIRRFENLGVKVDELCTLYNQSRLYPTAQQQNSCDSTVLSNLNPLIHPSHLAERMPLTVKNTLGNNLERPGPPPAKKLAPSPNQSIGILQKSQSDLIAKQFAAQQVSSQQLLGQRCLPDFLKRSYRPIQLPLASNKLYMNSDNGPMVLLKGKNRSTLPLQFTHAPLPPNPPPVLNPSHLNVQPACHLSIKASGFDVTLTWTLHISPDYPPFEMASHYEIFSYNSSEIRSYNSRSSSIWKLIGESRALPLPMTCVIRDVAPGHIFYFCIYSVDCYGRRSNWSNIVQAIVS